MQQYQVKRKRAVSAKFQRRRPVSAVVKGVEKAEFIQKVYVNGPQLGKRPKGISFNGTHLMTPQEMISLYTSKEGRKQNKKSEHLIQENIYLKKKNHKLEQEVSSLATQLQAAKRKNLKFTKNLDIEFQNQVLWTGNNNYMITGVKNQYENLKKKYQEKIQECDKLKKLSQYSYYEQYKKYSQVLQNQNVKLVQKINQLQIKTKVVLPQNSNVQKMNAYLVDEMKIQTKKLKVKINQLQTHLSQKSQELQDYIKKNSFLQKLIIQKDNDQHAEHRKNKNMQKNKEKMINQINELKQQIMEQQKMYQNRIQQNALNEKRKSEAQRELFKRTLAQQCLKTQKLQKQIAYLTTLLSYWKPLDQNNSKNVQKQSNQDKNISLVLSKTINIVQENKKAKKNSQLLIQNTLRNSLQFSKVNQKNNVKKPRVPKTADKKNSQHSQKVRKVDIHQVQQIGEILKYRCIGLRISLEDVKKSFDYQKEIEPHFIQEQNQQQVEEWNKNYISMKQTKQVLMNTNFKLNQEQAKLFSRYLIEDATGEYVYCDQENQNKRSIVKSIIGTIIGDFSDSLQKSHQQIQRLTKIQLNKFASRVKTILEQMYPGGNVSKKKLFQIFVGSGMEIPEDVKQYIIGKLILQSEDLYSLHYKLLF